ncbi:MAG: hypothetical protein A2286_01740 [Gammaproteobacteria bacterium RIFOXYA12_FULL_61_12]|nr:MAG: hypothetical protein A2286_01740 [Gammaproteobacteria bacterium RIFOXYA12_FULL_61_12]OGT88452.1 MAG: hypothetical protein A2514_02175 [Gammaproteobacteria bacterium RIFOXYD12_FULL_61_37]
MNALKNHVLHEVAQLDNESLLVLQPLLVALKRPSIATAQHKRGIAAARCRQVLANLKGDLSQTIHEEREDRV